MPHLLVAHPSADVYGSDLQLCETVRAATDGGWRVAVTVPAQGPLVPLLEAAGARVVVDARTPVLRKSALTPLGLVRLALSALRSVVTAARVIRRSRPDVLLVNTLTVPTWLVAARLARVPAVCHVHEAEDGVGRWLRRALAAPLHLARTVVVNSRASGTTLTEVDPGLAGRLVVVHNGVPDAGHPAAPRRRAPGDPARLALVGRLSPRKGVDVALEAVALLRGEGRDVTLDVCGTAFPGYEPFVEQLTARAARKDLAGAVRLLGYVSPTRPVLDAADVVLVPSRQEPFGNTAVEALLARRPLVASDVQGLAEIVTDGVTGRLVPPGDAAALARAVAELLDDPGHAARLAAAGRAEAEERFSTTTYRAALLAVLDDLVADDGARGSDAMPDEARGTGPGEAGPGEAGPGEAGPGEAGPGEVGPGAGHRRPARVTVAIVTYRREELLAATLDAVVEHVLGLDATLRARTDVLVVDNDPAAGARATVHGRAAHAASLGVPVRHVHEPRPGIGAARARALAEAADDALVVFLDDDGRPGTQWLAPLVATWRSTGATLVAGTILPGWEAPPSAWVEAGGFFRRPVLPTGTPRRSAPSGNLLVDVARVRGLGITFDAGFGLTGGEDTLFTRSVTAAGGRLVACAEAEVVDLVPAARTEPAWLLGRVYGHACTAVAVEVALTPGPAGRARVRAASVARGAAVVGRGLVGRLAVSRRPDVARDARARRDLARGRGLVAGGLGLRHEAYRRTPDPAETPQSSSTAGLRGSAGAPTTPTPAPERAPGTGVGRRAA